MDMDGTKEVVEAAPEMEEAKEAEAPKVEEPEKAAEEPEAGGTKKVRSSGICTVKAEYYMQNDEWQAMIGPCGDRVFEEYKGHVIKMEDSEDAEEAIRAAQELQDKQEAEKAAKEAKEKEEAELAEDEPEEPLPPRPERPMCCNWSRQTNLEAFCSYGDSCRFLHEDDGKLQCQYGARCGNGHASRAPQRKRSSKAAGVEEELSKRQRTGRGQNKGRDRKAHSLHMRGNKPAWTGEINFMPQGFARKWREKIRNLKWRKDWKCTTCNYVNNAKYNAFSCYSCFKLISKEEDEKSTYQENAALEPASAGWYNPREKKQLDWKGKAYLSPLTTVGNLPYRRVCVKLGADITCSEMACADNLIRMQPSEWALLRKHESEKFFGIQIASSNPTEAAICAKVLSDLDYDYDFVDLNCGCPIDVMYDKGMGSALGETRNRSRLRGILTGLHYQPKPVTMKVRIGTDERAPTLGSYISEIDTWGVQAITIHGRSKRQRYTRLADWNYLNECAAQCPVPVIGNGDLFDYTGFNTAVKTVDSVMSGRGALIKPWLFTEIKEQRHWDISSSERFEILKDFTKMGLDHWGADLRGRATTRKFLCEWLGFLCRYVPVGIIETLPQKHNERPQSFVGRNDLETLMGSDKASDWVRISELILGPCEPGFTFTPKHKSSAYTVTRTGQAIQMRDDGGIDLE
eukprot:TRINITY_DN4963_c1_g1_i3.p1 TRINITY_DN4963_c1_g1~~TRINITY_DN4963_c1_g1_i3.p1  ORF type:complete len:686 (+),score=238.70 TRINITY_DN4963_c1_g1_i3:33-2090(+)